MNETKSFAISEVRDGAAAGEPDGTFTALVSVFGNVDGEGDVVHKGAFEKSIARFRAAGKKIPVIYSHDNMNLDHWIGSVDPVDAVETNAGLMVKAQLDMDDRYGRKVHKLMADRVLTEFSFSYRVVKGVKNRHGGRDLLELDLLEAGPTLRGMNPSTALLSVKSLAEAEAGSLSKETADIRDRIARLRGDPPVPATLTGEEILRRLDRGTKTATPAVAEVAPALRRAPQHPGVGASLGGLPGGKSCAFPGCGAFGAWSDGKCPEHRGKSGSRQFVNGSMVLVDLDEILAAAELEARRTAQAAAKAAEDLEAARAAVKRADENGPDAA